MSTIYINSYLQAAAWYAGLTDLVAVYQPKGAASLAASYVNLVNPGTYDAAPGVAPTFAGATGWTFNGTTQYLTSGVAPAITWTVIARFANAVASIGGVGAYNAGSDNFFIRPANGVGNRTYASGGERNVVGAQTACVMALAGKNCYLNGVSDGTIGAGGSNTRAIGLGSVNASAPIYYYSGDIIAVAICSSTQSAGQIAAASAAVAAL